MRDIRTRRHKYVKFLYPELEMPLPSDLFESLTCGRRCAREGTSPSGIERRHPCCTTPKRKDPLETKNLALSDDYAGVLKGLRNKMQHFRRETKDPWWIVDRQRGEA